MDTHIPIAVVHLGCQDYLNFCLCQARKANPENPIILFGDASTAHWNTVEHCRVDDPDLSDDIQRFRSVYQHHGHAHDPRFEQFCIERWFVLRNFMWRRNLRRCLCIDSDVMLFCNVDDEASRFAECAMTFARWDDRRNLAHCNFIQNRDALDSFCQHVLEVYQTPRLLDGVAQANRNRSGRAWVSDMSLFADWGKRSGFSFGYFEDYYEQGVCFDNCIDAPQGFRGCRYLPGILRSYKSITIIDGVPHGTLRGGRRVPFKCLHYHGGFKFLMGSHLDGIHPHGRVVFNMLGRKIATLPHKVGRFVRTDLAGRLG